MMSVNLYAGQYKFLLSIFDFVLMKFMHELMGQAVLRP